MTRRRLNVQEAAGVLGVSVDAVRMRVRRGSLDSEKGEDGRVYVWVDTDEDNVESEVQDEGSRAEAPLVEDLRDQVLYLREQLAQANERDRENKRIIAALTSRIPELEAPASGATEAPEAPTGGTEQPGRGRPQAQVEGAQAGAQRPWWRRVFGG